MQDRGRSPKIEVGGPLKELRKLLAVKLSRIVVNVVNTLLSRKTVENAIPRVPSRLHPFVECTQIK